MKIAIILPLFFRLCFALPLTRPRGATHLAAVLEATGLEKAEVEKLTGLADDTKDFKPDEFVGKVTGAYETKLMNDQTFLEKIKPEQYPETLRKAVENGQYGRFMNEFREVVKKQGIDTSDLTKEEQDGLGKYAVKVFEKLSGKLQSPDATKQIQAELQKALHEKSELETGVPTRIKEAEDKVRGEMGAAIRELVAATELASIDGFETTVKPGLIIPGLLKAIESKFTLVTNGTSIELMQKANPALKAIDEKGKEITFTDVLKAEAIAAKAITEKKAGGAGGEGGSGTTKIEVAGDATKVIGGSIMEKIEQNKKIEEAASKGA